MYEKSYYDSVTFSTGGFYKDAERTITAHFPEGYFSLARDEQKWYQKMFGVRAKSELVEGRTETKTITGNPNDFDVSEAKVWFKEIGLPDDFSKRGEAVLLVLKTYHKQLLNEMTLKKKEMYAHEKMYAGGYISKYDSSYFYEAGYMAGGAKLPSNVTAVLDLMPEFDREQKFKHPVHGKPVTVTGAIMDLNDNHGWSREQIADWLETLDADLTIGGSDG